MLNNNTLFVIGQGEESGKKGGKKSESFVVRFSSLRILYMSLFENFSLATNLSPCVHINVEKSINHFYAGTQDADKHTCTISKMKYLYLSLNLIVLQSHKEIAFYSDNATSKQSMNNILHLWLSTIPEPVQNGRDKIHSVISSTSTLMNDQQFFCVKS